MNKLINTCFVAACLLAAPLLMTGAVLAPGNPPLTSEMGHEGGGVLPNGRWT